MEPERSGVEAAILGDGAVAPFGLGGRERLRRQLSRLGVASADAPERATLILSGDRLYGAAIPGALADAPPGTALLDDAGRPCAVRVAPGEGAAAAEALADGRAPEGSRAMTGRELAGRHDATLRKRADPVVMPLTDRDAAERALYAAAYKGVTDLVTKHVWPAPALAATRLCARLGITPNQVTWASVILTVLAFWLFWRGDFLPGLAAAWAMTFLDTVDGKLARVTLAGSRFGDVLDHGLDLVHPPFWWWAWGVGCAAAGDPLGDGGLTVGVIVAGYVLQRGEEGLFLARHGIEMHVWRRFDSLFRLVTARRNPNLLILSVAVLLGAPREGLIAVAVWTVLCFGVHAVRIVQAELARRRGRVVSWLAEG
ncbi:MAG TPA: CDP-alcohol phosphatidyltransferase family protein [Paracoccaceae bacterium]|nr:CDP-alcohol phosphatidyltransferase family protein [Paracoccaceae bacterium]